MREDMDEAVVAMIAGGVLMLAIKR